MQIPLTQFEQFIEDTILKRGLSYFKKGQVQEVEETSSGQYEAVVQGTEEYRVRLQIKDHAVTHHLCSCPYDQGPVCKHIVAVIFYLQQETLGLQPDASKEKPQRKKRPATETRKKRKTVAGKVDELLGNISHDELKDFVRQKAAESSPFRNTLLSAFAHQNTDESQGDYNKQIRSILRQAAGRDGFIPWSATGHVGRMMHGLMVTARNHFDRGNFQSAIFISCAMLEEMTKAFQFADDSNGDIGGAIDEAIHLLGDIASAKLSDDLRKSLLAYCIKAYQKELFEGWDWHTGMLNIAVLLVQTQKETDQMMALLDGVIHTYSGKEPEWTNRGGLREPSGGISRYEMEQALRIKLLLLKKTGKPEAAEQLIRENLSTPTIRRTALENAFAKGDYDEVVRIAEDGMRKNRKQYPGLVHEWQDWQLKVAVQKKDRNTIIDHARQLFIGSHRDKEEYWQLMKTHVEVDEWPAFVEKLVSEMSKRDAWGHFHTVARIFIDEAWWDRLIQWVREGPLTLEGVREYEPYLAKDYPDDLAGIYEQKITEYLQQHTGRGYYQTACRFLRRMRKLGAGEKVDVLIDRFRKEYPQRKALLEELERV
ncbi:MAG: SWIM zinc finger family protein [Flavobacteriales bacterium]|nr:SWIM zinc finger family protein [Flavobacteriales bacterium]